MFKISKNCTRKDERRRIKRKSFEISKNRRWTDLIQKHSDFVARAIDLCVCSFHLRYSVVSQACKQAGIMPCLLLRKSPEREQANLIHSFLENPIVIFKL